MKNLAKWREIPSFIQKIVRVMKISVFLVLVCSLQLSASVMLGQKVSLQSGKMSIRQVFKELKTQTGTFFMYSEEEISKGLIVDVDFSNVSLEEALDDICEEALLNYEIVDDYVLVTKKAPVVNEQAQQEKKELQGTVTDENGNALPGVCVVVKGTTIGVATDIDGNYSITFNGDNVVLVYSFVGMESQDIKITNQTTLNVILKDNKSHLGEVIVTGYQRLTKERSTGSFVTVDVKQLDTKLQSDFTQVLEGQIAGLERDDDGNITIRGVSTFLNAEKKPLIVLDGFPYNGDLSSINSTNIENITVLKDGVAASIYGARSANGVIVITTKSGKKDSFEVSYKGTLSTTLKNKYSDFNRGSTSDYIDGEIASWMEYPRGTEYYYWSQATQFFVDELRKNPGSPDYTEAYEKLEPLRGVNAYDGVFEHVHRAKMTQTHNIGINGGSEKNFYNLAVNFANTKGDMIHKKSNRFTLDFKNDWHLKDWISIGINTNLVYSSSKASKSDWQTLLSGDFTPYLNLFDENGNSKNIRPMIDDEFKGFVDERSNMNSYEYNPIEELGLRMNHTNSLSVRTAANINVKINKDLSLNAGGMWSRQYSNNRGIDDADSFYVRDLVNRATDRNNSLIKNFPNGDVINETRGELDNWNLRAQLNFNHSFKEDKHIVSAIAGMEIQKSTTNDNEYATRAGYNSTSGGFVDMNIKDWNSGVNRSNYVDQYLNSIMYNGRVTIRDFRYVSYYGNASYEFDNKYIISGSARLDLTNFFGTDPKYRYKPTWSIGGTWKVNNEDFFNFDAINRLNLRASYGINGNISLNNGPFLILSSSGYSTTTGGVANHIVSPPNNQLRWEKTAITNFGLDISLLNNKLNITAEYYKKKSTDLLANDQIDPITGFTSLSKNVGSLENRGYELTINHILNEYKVKWNTTLNLAYNDNKVIKYDVNRPYVSDWTYGGPGLVVEGYGMDALFSQRFAGLNNKGEVMAFNANDEKVGIGTLTPDDLVYMGSFKNPYMVSFTNQFSYNNFELSIMLLGKFGGKYRKDSFYGSNYTNQHFSERWQEPGDEENTIYPKFALNSTDRWYFPNVDVLVGDRDFVKLRDITLSYSLPENLVKKIGFNSLKTYVQARNVYTFKGKDVDIDPETLGIPRRPEFYLGLSFNF